MVNGLAEAVRSTKNLLRRQLLIKLQTMSVTVHFYSYFKDLAGCADATESIIPGTTIAELQEKLFARFPKLASMQKSMLVAVGVEYQPRTYLLKEGDEVSLFPPVQGG
jgi:molybdopterin converting factor small subunit